MRYSNGAVILLASVFAAAIFVFVPPPTTTTTTTNPPAADDLQQEEKKVMLWLLTRAFCPVLLLILLSMSCLLEEAITRILLLLRLAKQGISIALMAMLVIVQRVLKLEARATSPAEGRVLLVVLVIGHAKASLAKFATTEAATEKWLVIVQQSILL
jgi:hypothetical protein